MEFRSTTFTTADGLLLEGRLALAAAPVGAAVLCHPHPSYEGSMSSAMIPVIWRTLATAGWTTLRFNFRGVGRSEGVYGHGIAELKDVAAALAAVRREAPDVPVAAAGWSFGSVVGLHATMIDGDVGAYVAIAPPVSIKPHMELPLLPPPERLASWTGRMLAICGTTDGFCTPAGLRKWAEHIPGARTRIFEGEDHFFTSGRAELAEAVTAFIGGNAGEPA